MINPIQSLYPKLPTIEKPPVCNIHDCISVAALFALYPALPQGTRFGITKHMITYQPPQPIGGLVGSLAESLFSKNLDWQSIERTLAGNDRSETSDFKDSIQECLYWYQYLPIMQQLLSRTYEGLGLYANLYTKGPYTDSLNLARLLIQQANFSQSPLPQKVPAKLWTQAEITEIVNNALHVKGEKKEDAPVREAIGDVNLEQLPRIENPSAHLSAPIPPKDSLPKRWSEAEINKIVHDVLLALEKKAKHQSVEPDIAAIVNFLNFKQKEFNG